MKDMVISELSRPELNKFAFGFGSIYINGMKFFAVKQAVEGGKISVEFSSKIGSKNGKYVPKKNMLVLGFKKTAADPDREALVVHECVHAALDIEKKAVLVKESEAAAYIAQCLYFYYRNEAAILAGSSPTFANPVLNAAWKVSEKPRKGSSTIADADLQPLYAAIAAHPKYKSNYSENEEFDGV